MHVTILPFSADHVEAAAALLAARHARDRERVPELPAVYGDPAAALPVLRDLLAADTVSGVVALREGRIVAYLLGSPAFRTPTSPFAGLSPPRAADMPYAGHAADPEVGSSLYPVLYAALAQHWVANGIIAHTITVPADPDALETWGNLGFGRFFELGVRPTAPRAEQEARLGTAIEYRLATPDDEEAVGTLVTEMFRAFADPPVFMPFLPETAAERRRLVAGYLADPACPCWLALADGRPVGLHQFQEPASPTWHRLPLETPERAVYLQFAATAPEARGTGVGTALVGRTMAWAREAGYDACMAHYLIASRAAAFWRGCGFRPVSHELTRVVDERATWAHGRA